MTTIYKFERTNNHGNEVDLISSLLFLMYVNDCLNLSFHGHGHIQMYADDTVLIYSCNDDQQLHNEMQTDLESINN